MTLLASTPQYAVVGKTAKLRFSLTESGADFVRVWLTDAPKGSPEKAKLDESRKTRILFYQGDGGEHHELDFTPTVAGNYSLVAQEYIQGAANYGGGYQDAPDSFQTETKVGSEVALTLRIGSRLVATVGTGSNTATLVIYVWNDTIRETTLALHGEKSPDIVNPSSPAARFAALDSDVQVKLAALVDTTATTALGSLSTIVDNLITKFGIHRTQATVHAANDTDNTIDASFASPSGPAGIIKSANELLSKLENHFRNAKVGTTSADGLTGSQGYHAPSAVKRADLANLPIASPASDAASVVTLIADMWRAYEAHRVATAYHNNADTTNSATALSTLLDLHRYFLNSLRQSTPSTPATEHSAAVQFVQSAGFREES